jgi:hypothetical protein
MNPYAYSLLYSVATEFLEIVSNKLQGNMCEITEHKQEQLSKYTAQVENQTARRDMRTTNYWLAINTVSGYEAVLQVAVNVA